MTLFNKLARRQVWSIRDFKLSDEVLGAFRHMYLFQPDEAGPADMLITTNYLRVVCSRTRLNAEFCLQCPATFKLADYPELATTQAVPH